MELIIWNDGCSYQNRKAKVFNLIKAQHMQCAKVSLLLVTLIWSVIACTLHSVILCLQILVNVFTDSHYVKLMQEARINPKPYVVKQMKDQEFEKMISFPLKSIRPGKEIPLSMICVA